MRTFFFVFFLLWSVLAFGQPSPVDICNPAYIAGTNTASTACGFVGNNRLAVIGAGWYPGSVNITNVTYGGVNATLLATAQAGVGSAIYYLVNPPEGSQTLAITWGSAVDEASIGGLLLSDAAQSNTFGAPATGTGTGSPISITVPSASGELVIDVIFGFDMGTVTVGPGQTQQWFANPVGVYSSTEPGASPNVVMSWTHAGTDDWASVGGSIRPVGGGRRAPLMVIME